MGTSIKARISVYWSRSRSLTSVTRNPLLRTGSTRPSRARSSIASRTGVAEMPKSSASVGAEYTWPGRSSPEIRAARRAWATWSRSRSRVALRSWCFRCPMRWWSLRSGTDHYHTMSRCPCWRHGIGPARGVELQRRLALFARPGWTPWSPPNGKWKSTPVVGALTDHSGVEPVECRAAPLFEIGRCGRPGDQAVRHVVGDPHRVARVVGGSRAAIGPKTSSRATGGPPGAPATRVGAANQPAFRRSARWPPAGAARARRRRR